MSTNKAQSLNLMFVDAKEARWSKLNAADFKSNSTVWVCANTVSHWNFLFAVSKGGSYAVSTLSNVQFMPVIGVRWWRRSVYSRRSQ